MDNILTNEMEKATAFFKAHRSGKKESDPCYFRLGNLKSISGTLKYPSSTFFVNYDEPDMDEALYALENAIKTFGNTCSAYIIVSLVTSSSSNNTYLMALKNPYFQGQTNAQISGFQNQNGIGSMNQMQSSLALQQQMFEMQLRFTEKINKMETDNRLREKEEEIAALQANNETKIDKILGFVESPAYSKLYDSLLGLIKVAPQINQANPNHIAEQQPTQQPVQEQPQSMQASPQTDLSQEDQEKANSLMHSVAKMSKVFPNITEAMELLAAYCEAHPNLVQDLLEQQKKQKQHAG